MKKNQPSQAKPMIIWGLLVAALVAIVIAIGVVLFFAPGRSNPPQKSVTPLGPGK